MLHPIPVVTIAFGKQRIAGFVGIPQAEVAQKAFVIMVLNVLECGLRNRVLVRILPFRVAESPERESQIDEATSIAVCD